MNKWTVETLDTTVDEELDAMPADIRAGFVRASHLIEEFGPFRVGMPHIRSLDDKLWEIRVSGRDGIARGIFVLVTDKRVIIVHAFIKKTQKTPVRALRLARTRAKEAGLL